MTIPAQAVYFRLSHLHIPHAWECSGQALNGKLPASLSYLCRALGCGWQSRAAIPGETSRGLLPAGNGLEAEDSRNSRFRILECKSVPLGEKPILLTIWVNHLAERGVKKKSDFLPPCPREGLELGPGTVSLHQARDAQLRKENRNGRRARSVSCKLFTSARPDAALLVEPLTTSRDANGLSIRERPPPDHTALSLQEPGACRQGALAFQKGDSGRRWV